MPWICFPSPLHESQIEVADPIQEDQDGCFGRLLSVVQNVHFMKLKVQAGQEATLVEFLLYPCRVAGLV